MSCDSLHATISQKYKKEINVYNPEHCIDIIKKCKNNNFVKYKYNLLKDDEIFSLKCIKYFTITFSYHYF